MKTVTHSLLLLCLVVGSMCATPYGSSEEFTMVQGPKHSIYLRAPRSIGNFFRRFWGRGDKSAQVPFMNPYAQGSSYYPQYAPVGSQGSFAPQGYAQYPPQGTTYQMQPQPAGSVPQPLMYPQAPITSASVQYPQYTNQIPIQQSPSSGSPDFHAVLDSLVRNAGVAPAGSMPADQEASASSIVSKGDTPVFSFKKLYSFPFYLNSDNAASSGFNLNIPYMKRHIRRSSTPSAAVQVQEQMNKLRSIQMLRQAQEQQKLVRALQSSEVIASYLQQYLKNESPSAENMLTESKLHRPMMQPQVTQLSAPSAESAYTQYQTQPQSTQSMYAPSASAPTPTYTLPSQYESYQTVPAPSAPTPSLSQYNEPTQAISTETLRAILKNRRSQLNAAAAAAAAAEKPLTPDQLYASPESTASMEASQEVTAESQYRPSMVAYYADPSTASSSHGPGPLSMRASVASVSDENVDSRKNLIIKGPGAASSSNGDEPRAIHLTSSYSMGTRIL